MTLVEYNERVTQRRTGGGCLFLVIVLSVLGIAYHLWERGTSVTPAGVTTSDGAGRYVALGDSYTASPGTGRPVGAPSGCDRSDNNYPSLLAAKLRPAEFVDVSCGGATTEHLTGEQKTRDGTNAPQLDAVTGSTTLVTVGIGGNDVGFVGFGGQCATQNQAASPCKTQLTAGGRDQLAERITAAADRLGGVLDQIRAKAHEARIVVVGYPTVLPDDNGGCWPVLPVGEGDVAYLRDSLKRLNTTLQETAKAHEAGFADMSTASKGRDMCSAANRRWVEGPAPAVPGAPLHPNARGEEGMAEVIQKLLKVA
ncbi:SGNH/GDSL hydrolase family protein [Amycolatopsis alba]|uniref:GDSL family lipase n=1 Tax=Amycolatopsis alba DSM 44262 TaxID=1125972 RepID=A0A229S4N2_AMYAL|nr:SGNH/GDSL hydrolase family protein [Amycolatopsis alba]OXM53897.1 GDSL family lipase [Amycolatopsis alba DSM 44262]